MEVDILFKNCLILQANASVNGQAGILQSKHEAKQTTHAERNQACKHAKAGSRAEKVAPRVTSYHLSSSSRHNSIMNDCISIFLRRFKTTCIPLRHLQDKVLDRMVPRLQSTDLAPKGPWDRKCHLTTLVEAKETLTRTIVR